MFQHWATPATSISAAISAASPASKSLELAPTEPVRWQIPPDPQPTPATLSYRGDCPGSPRALEPARAKRTPAGTAPGAAAPPRRDRTDRRTLPHDAPVPLQRP